MFREELESVAVSAANKVRFLQKNPAGYFLLAMMAGIFIGIGVLLSFSIGGILDGASYTKIVMGASFGIALSLVVIAGGELFTGNNFVLAAGVLKKSVSLCEACKLWMICWLGNLAGGIVLALLFYMSGLGKGNAAGSFMAVSALAKMSATVPELFARGVLCNFLVSLATWCGFRTKSEVAKLIMIFWCLYAFITTGYEHSIANMTLFAVALFSPMGNAVSISGAIYNLAVVTLGNMVGGIVFVAFPYFVGNHNG